MFCGEVYKHEEQCCALGTPSITGPITSRHQVDPNLEIRVLLLREAMLLPSLVFQRSAVLDVLLTFYVKIHLDLECKFCLAKMYQFYKLESVKFSTWKADTNPQICVSVLRAAIFIAPDCFKFHTGRRNKAYGLAEISLTTMPTAWPRSGVDECVYNLLEIVWSSVSKSQKCFSSQMAKSFA